MNDPVPSFAEKDLVLIFASSSKFFSHSNWKTKSAVNDLVNIPLLSEVCE